MYMLYSFSYDSGEGKMSIDHVNPADERWYRCNGTNAYGTDTAAVELLVSVGGDWSSWSSYGDCSASCGGGTQMRTRTCDNPVPRNRGKTVRAILYRYVEYICTFFAVF